MTERYLANDNFPAEIVRALRAHGHDVLYAAETLLSASDVVILEAALEQDRVLLTFDRFGEMVFRHRSPSVPGIVLFRLSELSPDGLLTYLRSLRPRFEGLFTVASPGHFRHVPLDKTVSET